MKKSQIPNICLIVFLVQLAAASAVFFYLKHAEYVLVFKYPFFMDRNTITGVGVGDFILYKYNFRALVWFFFLVNIIALAGEFLQSRRVKWLMKTLFVYAVSSMACGMLLYPLIHPWVSGSLLYVAGLAFGYFPARLGFWGFLKNTDQNKTKIIRGVKKLNTKESEEELLRLSDKESKDGKGIKVYKSLKLPFEREAQHILVVGSTGSGKTQIIWPLIEQVMERGDKAVIWDVKGDYTQALISKKQVDLLAPWDERSVQWCIGRDIRNLVDCQNMSYIFLPENLKDSQPYFRNAARDILKALLTHMLAEKEVWGWRHLWDAISQGRKNLSFCLGQTEEGRKARVAIEASNRSSLDVYSTLVTSCQDLSWLAKAWPKDGISLKDWFRDSHGRTLILGGIPERKRLASLTANLALQTMVSEILSLPNDLNRRVWLFLDEFGSLGRNDCVLDAFSVGRSKGMCCVIGIQDIGKIEYIYGRELARSIVNSFSTSIFLRSTDPDTSQWVSRILGEQEIREHYSTTESTSSSKGQSGKQESKTESVHTKPLFLPSEISNFEVLSGVLNVSGWPIAKLKWPVHKMPNDNPVTVDAAWVSEIPKFEKSLKNIVHDYTETEDMDDDSSKGDQMTDQADWDLKNQNNQGT